jgi:hypothetical protein
MNETDKQNHTKGHLRLYSEWYLCGCHTIILCHHLGLKKDLHDVTSNGMLLFPASREEEEEEEEERKRTINYCL